MSSQRSPVNAEYDAIIIGGGPAGSSTAGLLARQGHRVLLLEKEKFPRYHIGESLITGCVSVLDGFGIRERADALGFGKKFGGSLVWGADGRWSFTFTEAQPEFPHAYNVRRADFDALILTRARELGAHVIEEAVVHGPVMEETRVSGVRYALRGREEATVRARIVVDASGQARTLGRSLTTVRWNEDLRNVAIWSYYQNGEVLRGDEAGNIFIEHVPGGWFWYIPIHDGTHSVGFVTSATHVAGHELSLAELFDAALAGSTHLRGMLAGASRVSAYRSARDWSYVSERFTGPGWMLVGDAAAFVDPLFSTGVTLAMLAASAAAKVIIRMLRDPGAETSVYERYERSYREFLDNIVSFVTFFYDAGLSRESYHQYAQALVDPERLFLPRKDFVTLISGLNSLEPIFDIPVSEAVTAVP